MIYFPIHRDSVRRVLVALFVFSLPTLSLAQSRRTRIAVVEFDNPTAFTVGASIRKMFSLNDDGSNPNEFQVLDRDWTRSATRGIGYSGSLNMSVLEARNLGAAIGCDYYFIVDAQTLRRSSLNRPAYYETYASLFLVSARTGRLVLWERPSAETDFPENSLQHFLTILSSAKSRHATAIRKASEFEQAQRASAITNAATVIEMLSDDDSNKSKDVQAPRPYRRLKPLYPDTAARADVEATVDVLVDVDAAGEVGHLEIVRWAGYGLDESVLNTVRQLHFFPAMRDGVPIPLRVLLRYNFRKPPATETQTQKQ